MGFRGAWVICFAGETGLLERRRREEVRCCHLCAVEASALLSGGVVGEKIQKIAALISLCVGARG